MLTHTLKCTHEFSGTYNRISSSLKFNLAVSKTHRVLFIWHKISHLTRHSKKSNGFRCDCRKYVCFHVRIICMSRCLSVCLYKYSTSLYYDDITHISEYCMSQVMSNVYQSPLAHSRYLLNASPQSTWQGARVFKSCHSHRFFSLILCAELYLVQNHLMFFSFSMLHTVSVYVYVCMYTVLCNNVSNKKLNIVIFSQSIPVTLIFIRSTVCDGWLVNYNNYI